MTTVSSNNQVNSLLDQQRLLVDKRRKDGKTTAEKIKASSAQLDKANKEGAKQNNDTTMAIVSTAIGILGSIGGAAGSSQAGKGGQTSPAANATINAPTSSASGANVSTSSANASGADTVASAPANSTQSSAPVEASAVKTKSNSETTSETQPEQETPPPSETSETRVPNFNKQGKTVAAVAGILQAAAAVVSVITKAASGDAAGAISSGLQGVGSIAQTVKNTGSSYAQKAEAGYIQGTETRLERTEKNITELEKLEDAEKLSEDDAVKLTELRADRDRLNAQLEAVDKKYADRKDDKELKDEIKSLEDKKESVGISPEENDRLFALRSEIRA